MNVLILLESLETSALGIAIAESAWLFPTVETLHVLSLVVVVGTIGVVDARLLGWGHRDRAVRALIQSFLPWTWGAFGIAAVTGFLLFSAHATRYFELLPFRLKLLLLVFTGLNMALFHLVTQRSVEQWNRAARPPLSARVAGGCSMLLWTGIVVAGRWMGFL